MAATREQIEAAIAEINETLNQGVTSVSVDGMSSSIDLTALRKRRGELRRELAALDNPNASADCYRPVQL